MKDPHSFFVGQGVDSACGKSQRLPVESWGSQSPIREGSDARLAGWARTWPQGEGGGLTHSLCAFSKCPPDRSLTAGPLRG